MPVHHNYCPSYVVATSNLKVSLLLFAFTMRSQGGEKNSAAISIVPNVIETESSQIRLHFRRNESQNYFWKLHYPFPRSVPDKNKFITINQGHCHVNFQQLTLNVSGMFCIHQLKYNCLK